MSQLSYELYYRRYGIRYLQSLISPPLFQLTELPKDSIIHSVTFDGQDDLDSSKLYFTGAQRKIAVDTIVDLSTAKGHPQRRGISVMGLIKPFFTKHKNFRMVKDHYRNIKDPLTLLVNNYSYLNDLYRYVVTPTAAYNKWWNTYNRMWETIGSIANESARHHFVFLTVPEIIPSFSLLNLYSAKTNVAMLKVFNDDQKLAILELWKWLNLEHREQSILNQVKKEQYHKVNLVFLNSEGKASLINLGYLNNWIKNKDNPENKTPVQVPDRQLQKYFLKYLLSVHDAVSATEIETTQAFKPSQDDTVQTPDDEDFEDFSEDGEDEEDTLVDDPLESDNLTFPTDSDTEETDVEVNEEKDILDVDEELEALEIINKKTLATKGIGITKDGELLNLDKTEIDTPVEVLEHTYLTVKSPQVALRQQLEKQVESGLLPANEYKKLLKDIENFSHLKNPYNAKITLVDASVITAQDLAIDSEKTTMAVSENVFDSTMVHSTLNSFDQDYINNVLQKDVLSMVSSLQKAGVVIKQYEIEEDHSALGSYENHTLEIKPLDGVASIVRFRIPKISEEGTFVSGGNKYLMRKQRVD